MIPRLTLPLPVLLASLAWATAASGQPADEPDPPPSAPPASASAPSDSAPSDSAPKAPTAQPSPAQPPAGDSPTKEASAAAPPASRTEAGKTNPRWPAPYGTATAPAPQPAPPSPPITDPPPPPFVHNLMVAEIGLRGTVIAHDGFQPYASKDPELLGQISVAAGIFPLRFSRLALGLMAEYDIGGRSETVRGDDSHLTAHRISLGLQANVDLHRRIYLFTRVAPAAVYFHGSIDDAAIDRPLVANSWTWGLDTTAGAGVLLGAVGRARPQVGFWLKAELGYAFAGEADMQYAPVEDDEDPRRFGSISLPAVSPRGFISRLALSISFL